MLFRNFCGYSCLYSATCYEAPIVHSVGSRQSRILFPPLCGGSRSMTQKGNEVGRRWLFAICLLETPRSATCAERGHDLEKSRSVDVWTDECDTLKLTPLQTVRHLVERSLDRFWIALERTRRGLSGESGSRVSLNYG